MSNGASSFPYKGWKGNQYEGGIKTPMIMTWKNKIKSNSTYNGFISSLDIFKTSVSIAKVEDSLTSKIRRKKHYEPIEKSLNNKQRFILEKRQDG